VEKETIYWTIIGGQLINYTVGKVKTKSKIKSVALSVIGTDSNTVRLYKQEFFNAMEQFASLTDEQLNEEIQIIKNELIDVSKDQTYYFSLGMESIGIIQEIKKQKRNIKNTKKFKQELTIDIILILTLMISYL
jgi:hypothetical protein